MSESILDGFNRPITYIGLEQVESTDSAPIIIKVPCVSGSWLTADDDLLVRVLVRLNGTSDSYVDVQVSPVNLNPFSGTTVAFDMVVRTNSVSGGVSPMAVEVRRTLNP